MSKVPKKDTTYTKLFVGNIPYGTNDETLRMHFEKFGPLEEAVVIRSKNDNASKGYGFVSILVCAYLLNFVMQKDKTIKIYAH